MADTEGRAAPPEAHRGSVVTAVAVALLTVIGLALRVVLAARSGLWRDEAQCLAVAAEAPSLAALFSFLRLHESHPPLFYLLLRLWQAIFGHSDTVALALPLIFGTVQIPALYIIGRRMFDRVTGLIATALGTFAPALAFYSADVRPYSLLPLLTVSALYLLWQGLIRPIKRSWIALAAVTAALLYTHNWSLFVLVGLWCAAAATLPLTSTSQRRAVAIGFLASQAAALLLYLPWLPALLYQTTHSGHTAAGMPPFIAIVVQGVAWTVGAPSESAALIQAIVLPIVFLCGSIAPILAQSKRLTASAEEGTFPNAPRTAIVILAVGALVAFGAAAIAALRTDTLWDRTVATVAPPLLLLLAYALRRLAMPALKRGAWLPPTVATIAVVALLYVPYLRTARQEWKSNAREAAAFVTQNGQPGDQIIVLFEWEAADFNRYFMGTQEQIDYPTFERRNAAWFDDTRTRLANPDAYRRLLARLAAIRGEGRRTWLLLPTPYVPTSGTPLPDDSAPLPPDWNFGQISEVRAAQIFQALAHTYSGGQAREAGLSRPGTPIRNGYRLFLFESPVAAIPSPPGGK